MYDVYRVIPINCWEESYSNSFSLEKESQIEDEELADNLLLVFGCWYNDNSDFRLNLVG